MMFIKKYSRLFVALAAIPLLIVSCRREETPTPAPATLTPTAVVSVPPTEAAQESPTPEPTAEPVYDWSPNLVYSSPAPGEELRLDGTIAIRFDQPMDVDSVEEALVVNEFETGEKIEGDIQWPRPDTVLFTPKNQLRREQLYELQLADSAKARNGKALRAPIMLRLQSVGHLGISQTIPAAGADGIDTDAILTVVFNRPVVPLVTTGQQSELPHPLTFTPAVDGSGEWISTSIYRFEPDSPLAGATRYDVAVNAGLEDVTGGELTEDYHWQFETIGPHVVRTNPVTGDTDVAPTQPLTVTFNMPMDKASTEGAISIEPSAPLSFFWSEDSRSVSTLAQGGFDLDIEYLLTIGQNALSENGRATLEKEEVVGFITVPFPAVDKTDPSDGEEMNRYRSGVNIDFASPMDFDTLDGKLIIDPEPEEVTIFPTNDGRALYVNFDPDRSASYQITIPGTAADPYGNTLGEDYSWQFTTASYPPLAALGLPDRVSHLTTNNPSDINIIHRNVSQIDLELYEANDAAINLISTNVNDYLPRGRAIRSWSIPVENVLNEAGVISVSLADGESLIPGIYYLHVAAPEIIDEVRWWQNQENLMVVADTNLIVKEGPESVHVWATNLVDGQPFGGAPVDLYGPNGTLLGSELTDSDGLATFPYEPGEDWRQGVLVYSLQPGIQGFGAASSSWSEGISPWEFGIPVAWNSEPERFGYIYTDRPIYRPGDTVHFRGIVRDTNFGRYPLPTRSDVSLSLDYVTDYEPLVWEFDTVLDENGEFSDEYFIPEDARLGDYRFLFKESDVEGYLDFSVAEYRKPEFLVRVVPDREEELRGNRSGATVEAEFFFGGSAADLEVDWSVYQKPFRFPWDGPYYSFGDNARFFFDSTLFSGLGDEGFVGDYLAGDLGYTDADGRFAIDLPADLLDEVDPGSRTVTVVATLFDVSNFPVSDRAEIVFHEAETYVGVVAAEYIGTAETDVEIDLITVDWDGQPVSDQDVEVVIYQREWIPVRETDDSRRFTRWEVEDTEVETIRTTTGSQGKASVSFIPSNGGSYMAVATVTDDAGHSQTSSTTLWIADSDFIGWQSDPQNRRMDLVADRQEYQPGDVARVLVQSPFEGPVKAWLTVERGEVLDQRIITLSTNSDVIDIPIRGEYAPNAFASIALVKGVDETNPYADMRLGMVELTVVPQQLKLNISLAPDQELLSPGETAVFDIHVSDHQGHPIEGNFSLALVDLAVLTLKEDNATDIAEAFYRSQPIRSQTGSGLIISGEGLEVEIPLEQLGRGGGGGGGEAQSNAVAFLDEENVRRDFPDTAFWEAKVSTDSEGRATVEIPLPDSLTTWRLSSKVVSDFSATGETLVGQSFNEVVVTLPLLVRPITPRFFTVGDRLQLGAIVHNNSGTSQDVTVNLNAVGLTLEGQAEQIVTIPDGGRELVNWQVLVDDVNFADLTFTAEAGDYRDATKPTFGIAPDQLIPVVRYSGEDFVGTSGIMDEAGRRVEAVLFPAGVDSREGTLSVDLSPSIAAALLDSLDYVNYNNDRALCAHVIADQLLPNATTLLAIQSLDLDNQGSQEPGNPESDELIRKSIEDLAELQVSDGGWGWCSSDESAPFLSGYVLLALAKAEQAGFSGDQSVINKAVQYIERQLVNVEKLSDPGSANRQAFFLYVLSELDKVPTDALVNLFEEGRDLLEPYGKGLLLLALDKAELDGAMVNTLIADLNNSVVLSASGAHWEDSVPDWFNLSSDIRNTAIILDALARVDPQNVLAPAAARWLMVARTAEHWPTGQQTAWSIQGLAKWMEVSGELDADYNYDLAINTSSKADGVFDAGDLTGTITAAASIDELFLDEVNFIDIQRGEGPGRLYYTAFLNSFIDADGLEPVNRGISVERNYYDAACDPEEAECEPIDEIEAGQQIRVELTIITANDLVYAIIEDPIPAGSEGLDPGLETTAADIGPTFERIDDQMPFGFWGWWYFDSVEFRDDRVRILSDFLPAGTYQYSYTLQSTIPGEYQVPPTTARQEFFPDVFGRSSGEIFTISP